MCLYVCGIVAPKWMGRFNATFRFKADVIKVIHSYYIDLFVRLLVNKMLDLFKKFPLSLAK